MKVHWNKESVTRLSDLKPGMVFKACGVSGALLTEVFMVVNRPSPARVVSLLDGRTYCWGEDTEVVPYPNATLVMGGLGAPQPKEDSITVERERIIAAIESHSGLWIMKSDVLRIVRGEESSDGHA